MSLPIFPDLPTMAWNSQKLQCWDTQIQKSGSGKRKSLSRWAFPEWRIECSYTCLSAADIERVAGFFALVRGQHKSFLWKDPEDYKQTKVRIGTGNSVNTDFQLLRNFANLYVEPVRDVVEGTLTVYVNEAPAAFVSDSDGVVKLAIPPAQGTIISASFEYYWRVVFDDEELSWSNFWYNYYKLKKIAVVTVK